LSGLVGLGAKYGELTATVGVKSLTLEHLPMRCPFCDQPIDRNNAWKGTADRFYCGEFLRRFSVRYSFSSAISEGEA
jgi:transposase-like protein